LFVHILFSLCSFICIRKCNKCTILWQHHSYRFNITKTTKITTKNLFSKTGGYITFEIEWKKKFFLIWVYLTQKKKKK
jgi:hypothetical protein